MRGLRSMNAPIHLSAEIRLCDSNENRRFSGTGTSTGTSTSTSTRYRYRKTIHDLIGSCVIRGV
jgi:hypothetical protein